MIRFIGVVNLLASYYSLARGMAGATTCFSPCLPTIMLDSELTTLELLS